jgi:tetratricopeptide (TPR) repeat protein
VERYVDTTAGPQAIKSSIIMALELGDTNLVDDFGEVIARRYPNHLELISFRRDHLGSKIFEAPFAGVFQCSEKGLVRFPMQSFGRSPVLVFWSKEGQGLDYVKALAETTLSIKDKLEGRMQVISFNLDELPDAGKSIIRELGVDWQCFHLPGGRKSPVYDAYVRKDPVLLNLTPSGQAAIGTAGSRRKPDGSPDFERTFGSLLARTWTQRAYCSQLNSFSIGDFLVFDTENGESPFFPNELKPKQAAWTLQGPDKNLTQKTLSEIQACFVAPPLRYQLNASELKEKYQKAISLCRKAISESPDARDLWIVRNRLIVALMGLWKVDSDLSQLEKAFQEAETAIAAGYPKGADLIARFCLARKALCSAEAESGKVIDSFLAKVGGEKATGLTLAAAAILSLDVADRNRFENIRRTILETFANDPSMWLITSFLEDRHHRYWLFQEPYTFGWIYHRREGRSQTDGNPELSKRLLRAELKDANNKPFRIPEDLTEKYTAIYFSPSPPWQNRADPSVAPSPIGSILSFSEFATSRPNRDVETVLAVYGDEAYQEKILTRKKEEIPCTKLTVPSGIKNPLVLQLGLNAEDVGLNCVLVDKSGTVLLAMSGLSPVKNRLGNTHNLAMRNAITRQDELKVYSLIENGEIEAAKEFIMNLAPITEIKEDDNPKKKAKTTFPHAISHMRARARMYLASKNFEAALKDAKQIVDRQIEFDGSMSLRSEQLDKDEAFCDKVKELMSNP